MAIQRKLTGQLRRGRKKVDARRKSQSAQILAGQILGHRPPGHVHKGSLRVSFRLACNTIAYVDASIHGSWWKAGYRGSWNKPYIASDDAGACIGNGGSAQNCEVDRSSQRNRRGICPGS